MVRILFSRSSAAKLAEACTVVCAIPTTERELRKYYRGSDLLDSSVFSKERYRRQVLPVFKTELRQWNRLGVRVVTKSTLSTWASTFDANVKAVVLLAHWKDDCIEMFDGLTPIERLVEGIPMDFSGVVDLCVCSSRPLARLLRRKRPRIKVNFKSDHAILRVWIDIYSETFRAMASKKLIFMDALEQVSNDFKRISFQRGGLQCRSSH